MEFLIAVLVLAVVGYVVYKHHANNALNTEPAVLDLVEEKIVEVAEPVVAEVKKAAPKAKKATKEISEKTIEEAKEIKAKVSKKKPNMKIVK